MIIRIIAVGKLKEKYWQEGVADYAKRLKIYTRLDIIEVSDARISEGAPPAEAEKAMAKEAEEIMNWLSKSVGLVVALERQGKALDSLELAEWLKKQMLDGQNEINLIIGGPLGLAPAVLDRADLVLSFSRLTFPHQLMRLILLEQLYRSFRIVHKEPYHK